MCYSLEPGQVADHIKVIVGNLTYTNKSSHQYCETGSELLVTKAENYMVKDIAPHASFRFLLVLVDPTR